MFPNRVKMTNADILNTALRQSALESGCAPEDFLSGKNKVVLSQKVQCARAYLDLPFFCDLTTYGSGVVASVSPAIYQKVQAYLDAHSAFAAFEMPALHELDILLKPHGMCVCFMAEYFLPDISHLVVNECAFTLRLLTPDQFAPYYLPQWSNALCAERRSLDVLAVGAFDGNQLIGLAGASADCETMWQIGVDVLPAYRRCGVASALTSRLAQEILAKGCVPFYCCAWSNIASSRNAQKSGFSPAWVQVTAKSCQFTQELLQNQKK